MTAAVIENTWVEKTPRADIIAVLRKRDGNMCMHPDCGQRLDFSVTAGQLEVTIDHWMPQEYGRDNDWTYEEIWDLSNLKLMHKKCNAKKGNLVPNEDGTLPERKVREFRYRRDKRATRAGLCEICDNGHNLAPDEVCASCGGDAQAYPAWLKVKVNECDHEISWCWACSIGVIERVPAVNTAVRHGNAGETPLVGKVITG